MLSIKDLVEEICSSEQQINGEKMKNISLLIDVSGSTGNIFNPGETILQKEIEVMTSYILSNPDNNYELYSFDSFAFSHGRVNILKEENFVDLPDFKPGSSTNTCQGLLMICAGIDKFRPDKVIIYTDGQTDNRAEQFKNIVKIFKDSKIKLEIVAVSSTDKNLETISTNEESRIPGMDLVNMLGNFINSLCIYNKYHNTIPFTGISNSSIEKNSVKFMGVKVNGFIVEFIDKLLVKINEKSEQIDWKPNLNDLKKMLSEFGKLLSIMFVQFPNSHPFLKRISEQIHMALSITPNTNTNTNTNFMDKERILKIIEYGFNCSKNDVPVILTNFEHNLKEHTTKHNEFADAVSILKTKGTGMGKSSKISIPTVIRPICIIDDGTVELTEPLDEFPCSKDRFGNVFFATDGNEQAIRIGMRKFCEKIGFPNSRNSPSVPFYVLNQMSLLYLKGVPIDSEHMVELRKIAKAQTSLEVMVAPNKYDGKGCWSYWKDGLQIPMHFSKPTKHTSLYTDELINPFKLSEPLWWALMMSMLGLFEEQKVYYIKSIQSLEIEGTQEEFLNWFKATNQDMIEGDIVLEKINQESKSIFTLDYFEPDEKIYEIKPHDDCKTKTCYSELEINEYVRNGGCVWCKYIPLETDFIEVNREKWDIKLTESMSKVKRINLVCNTVFESFGKLEISQGKKYRINLIGITGSGKSTCARKIADHIEKSGGIVLIVSADKWSKLGFSGKNLQNKVFNEILQFDQRPELLKVIVMDICNESGVSKNSFGFNFNSYNDLTFYPNLDIEQFDKYEAWCLSNVLSRKSSTNDSSFWLNPVDAGVNTCIKVHNMKASKIGILLGIMNSVKHNENLNLKQISDLIKVKSNNYSEYLGTRNLDQEIENFLMEKIIF
jgi:hypothetical protein